MRLEYKNQNENAFKFWEIKIESKNKVITKYGRIGIQNPAKTENEFSSKEWPGRYGNNVSGDYSPWVSTAGLGTKINLGYFLLKIEMAWDRNESGYSKPQWYFSLGPDW